MEMTPITFLVGPLYGTSLPIPCLGSQGRLQPELSMSAGTRGTQVLPQTGLLTGGNTCLGCPVPPPSTLRVQTDPV